MNAYQITFLSGALLAACHAAYADNESNNPDVRVSMGLGAINSARYLGSNERRYRLMPILNAQWQNGWFAGFPRGVGYNFSDNPQNEYGLRLSIDHGRKQNLSTALNGLGDIALRPELGAFYHRTLSREIKLNSGLRYGAGVDRRGALLDLGLNYRLTLAETSFLTLGIHTNYANNHYMQSYFGVTASQAASSGYAVSTPTAGLRELGLSAQYLYKIDSNWSLLTAMNYAQLGAIVQAAPMTRANSSFGVNVSTTYTF